MPKTILTHLPDGTPVVFMDSWDAIGEHLERQQRIAPRRLRESETIAELTHEVRS